MKSEWRVSTNHVCGEKYYQVYRLKDINAVHHSGNREEYGVLFGTREEAEAVARELNAEEAEYTTNFEKEKKALIDDLTAEIDDLTAEIEWIKGLNEDQLAKYIDNLEECTIERKCPSTKDKKIECIDCITEWFKLPAETGGDKR